MPTRSGYIPFDVGVTYTNCLPCSKQTHKICGIHKVSYQLQTRSFNCKRQQCIRSFTHEICHTVPGYQLYQPQLQGGLMPSAEPTRKNIIEVQRIIEVRETRDQNTSSKTNNCNLLQMPCFQLGLSTTSQQPTTSQPNEHTDEQQVTSITFSFAIFWRQGQTL